MNFTVVFKEAIWLPRSTRQFKGQVRSFDINLLIVLHLFVQRRALDSDKKTCRRHQHFPKVTAKENFKNRMAKEDIEQRSVFQNKNR